MPSGIYGRNKKMKTRLVDLIGQKFGRLIVIKRSFPDGKGGVVKWLCKCECGNEKIIFGGALKKGLTKSCGCLWEEMQENRKLPIGLPSIRNLMYRYKNGAKEREIEFILTEEQFIRLTQQKCHYCGGNPTQINIARPSTDTYIYNGLDRVDNNKGYTIENVVPCCKTCNMAKFTMSVQEFKDWVKRIYNNMYKL